MENNTIDRWIHEMEMEGIQMDETEISPVERFKHSIPFITKIISDLKNLVLKDGFKSQESEINF